MNKIELSQYIRKRANSSCKNENNQLSVAFTGDNIPSVIILLAKRNILLINNALLNSDVSHKFRMMLIDYLLLCSNNNKVITIKKKIQLIVLSLYIILVGFSLCNFHFSVLLCYFIALLLIVSVTIVVIIYNLIQKSKVRKIVNTFINIYDVNSVVSFFKQYKSELLIHFSKSEYLLRSLHSINQALKYLKKRLNDKS